MGFSLGELVEGSAAERTELLDAAKVAGANTIRIDISWATVQPSGPRRWTWGPVDDAVRSVHDAGLRLLPVIGYTPEWARDPGCARTSCPPADPQAFARFAAAAAARYAPADVVAWEVWNEPNAAFWTPSPDPVRYAKLLQVTAAAVRAAAPGTPVLLGGLAPTTSGPSGHLSPADFLRVVYQQGAQGSFDGVGVHPYCFPALPGENEPWAGWQQMLDVRALLEAQGDAGKGVWITEFGAPTSGAGALATLSDRNYDRKADHVSPDLQAATVTAAFQQLTGMPWVRSLLWYSVVDLPPQPDDATAAPSQAPANASGYGLVRGDGSPKPAFDAWRDGAAPFLR